MKTKWKINPLWILPGGFILFLSSCISLNLDSLKDKKAEGVVFQPPPESSYKRVQKKEMDASWENTEKGHTLSFFSNCSYAVRFTSLEIFKKDLLDELKGFRVLSKKESQYQDQKAYYIKLSQFHSGLPINLDLFLFKKVNCLYALSFLRSVLNAESADQTLVFKQFIREFRAP